MPKRESFLLFGGSSHPCLFQQITECLGVSPGKMELGTFPDGEIFVQVLENVRGRDVFILQSIAGKPNDYLMELLIIIDAMRRASARTVSVIIPYFGYSRQDRKDQPRVAITAKLVANLLVTAGTNRVLTMDLHADQLQGFFDIPLDNLFARPILLGAIRDWDLSETVIVAPDLGSIKMVRAYAKALDVGLAIVDKRRTGPDRVEGTTVIGDLKGKRVLLVDDICSTAGTLVNAASACIDAGAKEVYAAITHGLFAKQALTRLNESVIKKVFVTNTVPGVEHLKHPRIEQVSSAGLFSEAINCIISANSISSLFKKDAEIHSGQAGLVMTPSE